MIVFYSCMTVIFLIARPDGVRYYENKRRKTVRVTYNDELRRELEAHNCIGYTYTFVNKIRIVAATYVAIWHGI